MQLVATDRNPVPPGGEITEVATADGVRLRAVSWPAPAGRHRGAVLILQGRAEFVEKYFETVGDLRARGFAVVAFDWRGQGRSDRSLPDRSRGHVRSFADFRLDLAAIQARFFPEAPPACILAHSMGGCVALTGAAEGWLEAGRLVLSGPMLGLTIVRRPRLVRPLARLLAGLGMRTRPVPGGGSRSISTLPFEGNRLSGDPVRYARNRELAAALGWGAVGSPTVGWLVAAYEAMDRLARPGVAARIRMPVLVVAGGDDPVCSTPAAETFAAALPDGRLVVAPGARHEVLMETDRVRALFWEAFDAFPAGRDAAGPPADAGQPADGAPRRRSMA